MAFLSLHIFIVEQRVRRKITNIIFHVIHGFFNNQTVFFQGVVFLDPFCY